jgi:hypothetical protein
MAPLATGASCGLAPNPPPTSSSGLAALIAEHGYSGRFWNQSWVYLDVDDRKYWVSAELFGDGLIVNRARLEDVR